MKDIDNIPDEDVCRLYQSWLKTTLRNGVLSYIRRQKKQKKDFAQPLDSGEMYILDPYEVLLDSISKTTFVFGLQTCQQAYDQLSPRHRQVLEMIYVDCYPVGTVAEKLNYSIPSIYRLHREGIEFLKKELIKEDTEND